MRRSCSTLLLILLVSACAPPAFAQYVRVSVAGNGDQANFSSVSPAISADGRFVAFSSAATNFVAGDTNGDADVYLHDRDADGDGVFDELDPGARSTVRVSIWPDATEFTEPALSPAISGDGRYVTFLTNSPLPDAPANTVTQILRWDRQTGAIALVSQTPNGSPGNFDSGRVEMSDDGHLVIFLSRATNLTLDAPGEIGGVFLRDMQTGTTTRLSAPHIETEPGTPTTTYALRSPTISGDGRLAAFVRTGTTTMPMGGVETGPIYLVDLSQGTPGPAIESGDRASRVRLSRNGLDILVREWRESVSAKFTRQHVATGERDPSNLSINTNSFPEVGYALGRDARYAALLTEDTPTTSQLLDVVRQRKWPLPFTGFGGSLDATSRYLAITTQDALITPGVADTNNLPDIFVVDLQQLFDTDHDTLDDRWETFFGLNPGNGAGADGPTGDPDGDGITNADEEAQGTHPRGLHKLFLAEGATGSFFDTRLAIANPDASQAAAGIVTFLRAGEPPIRTDLPLDSRTRRTLSPTAFSGLEAAEFSIGIESDRPLIADRTMMWDATGYGAHTESAATAPSTTWYLAEGSTVLDFDLFYLLQNPQPTTVDATVRYLRPLGPPIERTCSLPPNSRTTIHVNQVDALLSETDVSGAITASAPIVVERAMYGLRQNQFFALGHATKGVTAPSPTWFLAEGATGGFFDLYVLIANPSTSDAQIEVRFLREDGEVVTQTHTVPRESRFSIFVDSVPGLESTPVATQVTSTNAVPVIVERAMYWPGNFWSYYEGHSSAGTTTTAQRWALAEGEEGGTSDAQTFVLIANTSNLPGQARISRMPDQALAAIVDPIVVNLPPNSRTTVELTRDLPAVGDGVRFGTLVESIGDTPVPIVVEGAFYWSTNGVTWNAGSNVVATPLP